MKKIDLNNNWDYAVAPESIGHIRIKKKYDLFIDGKFIKPGSNKYFDTINPATDKVIAKIAEANKKDVDLAVKSARKAFKSWSKLEAKERGKYIFRIARMIQERAREFSVIEPHSKLSWSEGRVYPFEKWQKIVDATKNKIKFVQIGEPNKRRLNNVIYLNGKTTFREASSILRKAKLFVSSEGGLVHLANATETKSIVIYTSYHVYLPIFHYPENVSIDTSLYREEIGGYKKHHLYKNETEKHNENEIIKAINENIYNI